MKLRIFTSLLIILISFSIFAQDNDKDKKEDNNPYKSETFNGLKFRSIGPAVTSGRVVDFAVNPHDLNEYYVAVACGNVWKTTNSGTSWNPIFDKYDSHSIGCVTLDPNNQHVVYIGTGENNSQRSVSWGNGIYRSEDGGMSFTNIGLKKSEHIAKILIDPRDSKVIYVAAQGPLWGPGGNRGLYKSTNYGATWDSVLYISPNTGVTDIVMDPRNPDVLYAASYQRRRHVWTLINGGPEGAIYKSTDAGKTWNKLTSGLPSSDVGRIGLAVSTVNPDFVYAIVEAANDGSGFYRSTNRGASWEKMSDYKNVSAQYYSEIFCDPVDVNKVYALDTYSSITTDGGKSFDRISTKGRHVDDHAFWINPKNANHFLIGGDGGIYETFDGGKQWLFKSNLPITQFYRIAIDNSEPFYWVYGGTQDNNSLGAPSQTINEEGIMNSDWIPTLGGDGFEPQVDPTDPNIIYTQYQYGELHRYDKRSGEITHIHIMEELGGEPYRRHWDSPLILSPHKTTRLYYAANKVFRSDDRGDNWEVISPDLSRQLDRNKLKVMDMIWSVDAVAKNASTSFYGTIVSLSESPIVEGLIYAGTDDGLIQVTEDGGKNWRRIESFLDVPEMSYVSCLFASEHDANTVYATFDNHKMADFKPYVLVSKDRGKSWKSIKGNLQENQVVYSLIQDNIKANLLFVGTEYGIYFSINEGKNWIQLKGGLPTQAVRDMHIQTRENDLVIGTFGRGIYILDNLTPLRELSESTLNENAYKLFPVKDALMFLKRNATFGSQGSTLYKADNPDFGATFTYYLKEAPKTLKQQRQKKEKELIKDNKPVYYPTWEELRKEDNEESPYLLFTVYDELGNVVRNLKSDVKSGVNRITWDLRYPSTDPIKKISSDNPSGIPVLPGKYSVTMSISVDGKLNQVAGPESFEAKVLNNVTLPASDRNELIAFQKKVAELNRAVMAAVEINADLTNRIELIKTAIEQSPGSQVALIEQANIIAEKNRDIYRLLVNDQTLTKRNEPVHPAVIDHISEIVWGMWSTSSVPTQSLTDGYNVAKEEFKPLLEQLKKLQEVDIINLENEMEKYDAPWTPGRKMPDWKE